MYVALGLLGGGRYLAYGSGDLLRKRAPQLRVELATAGTRGLLIVHDTGNAGQEEERVAYTLFACCPSKKKKIYYKNLLEKNAVPQEQPHTKTHK